LQLTYESRLKLHPIAIREDKKNYIVEDKITGEFFEMPEICVRAIEMIQQEIPLLEIEKKLKEAYPREEVDMLDFAGQLVEMDLVAELDGQTIEHSQRKAEGKGFLWIPEQLGAIFFNRFALAGYLIVFITNMAIFALNPHLIPRYKDLFVFDIMLVNILVYMVLSFVLVMVHELGHVLALRSVGMPAKVEIGHRLFLVVLETDMSQVWRLHAKTRNMLYLAGLCFDNVILFLALIGTLLSPTGSPIISGIFDMVIFDVIIRMIYQCCIYMKTDLYFVFENMTGCYNLVENAHAYLKELFFSKKIKADQVVFSGEKPVIVSYGLFYILGMVMTVMLFAVYFIPQTIYLVQRSVPGIMSPVGSIQFWDGAIVLLQLMLMVGLLLYSFRKNARSKSRRDSI
jgi:putative peptide zinc metalloprotease protein